MESPPNAKEMMSHKKKDLGESCLTTFRIRCQKAKFYKRKKEKTQQKQFRRKQVFETTVSKRVGVLKNHILLSPCELNGSIFPSFPKHMQ